MRTVPQYLDLMKAKLGLHSDYQLAKVLGCKGGRMSNYRTGTSLFDNSMCLKVAEILGLYPIEVIADMELQRAQAPEKKALWEKIAASGKHVAVWTFLSLVLMLVSAGNSEVYARNLTQTTYTLCEVRPGRVHAVNPAQSTCCH